MIRLLHRTRNQRAVVDLASVMVGVIVMAVIATSVGVGLFAVIPWTHSQTAMSQLEAIRAAQRNAFIGNGSYIDKAALLSSGKLSSTVAAAVYVSPDRSCYTAVIKTPTGVAYWIDNTTSAAGAVSGGTSSCTSLTALAATITL
ncbi:hypothetical protein [Leifsonia sp. Leaf264]|uniref:hypothetical protein n=1 Tax=Leifsonia sp. Leaf264 TaxID=1736314 RepID=UPI0007008CEB|nr:hypothetical protein [Leifsonia sp. Leaf264]KQO98207.1 hypothetical protein ASF30_09100 [Leifsonia sp. Leaf264]